MLNKKFAYRLEFLLFSGVIIICILIGRMFYLQILRGSYYSRQAEGNRTRYTRIVAPRGIIYDCNGEELANNKPGFMISLVRRSDGYNKETLERLSVILNLPMEKIQDTIKLHSVGAEPIRLVRNASPEVVAKIEENLRYLPGVMVEVQPVRYYPNKELAVHVLGYVGEVSDYEIEQGVYSDLKAGDIIGKAGLESYYDANLRGEDGSYREEVDVVGRVVQVMDKVEPKPGEGLVLTIDAKLQKITEEAVDRQLKAIGARGCAVVVLDPNNGEVKALVSRPGFDPNWFVNGISEKNWNYLNTDPFHPMTDKAIAGEYPPGSTFKIVTGSAALEEKKVTPDELIYDSGRHWLIDMRNAGGEALGYINFKRALAASDNVYFYEMGNRLGINLIDKYAKDFGFGQRTGIDLHGEAEGLIATPEYKKKVFDEDWYLGDTFNTAIGQGFTLATPIQVAEMMSAVATDGRRFKPHLVSKIINDDGSVDQTFEPVEEGKLPVSEATLKLVQEGLEAVTEEGGTASSLKNLPVAVAGKTGTAENPHGLDHGWFAAYAPAKKPQLVVVCIVEQGSYGAVSAVPIVKSILEYAFTDPRVRREGNKK
ncbi:penicillin-binding protein 2 [Acidaminococcus sp. NSJ-142]|uniref:penicillin-binding protein 2 n=1 Tax=Acidaminococcus TaxID=904 RepID=UPI000CF990B9|nr:MULTISPECIES: penicillin-binding protein 2 [Acidaminococcus]MCD2435740.1 penicillin-binding protein 2 [Acidaminococcus hominis]MCH4096455.1 penicillin-binding protein 2 [Acidaminococcus provencensis]RHK02870.1 penicillin-binding protein 2 [Acidaminococcus sp. AM05-11]